MKKLSYCLLAAALLLAAFTGCKKKNMPSVETTDTKQPVTTGATQTENTKVPQPGKQEMPYAAGPYVYIEKGHPNAVRSKLEKLDWNGTMGVLDRIPATHYEEYPNLYATPLTATLYKDGNAIILDAEDPRLIRLLNFYNNAVYYNLYTRSNGVYDAPTLDALKSKPFRLELTYSPAAGNPEILYDTIVVNDQGFICMQRENLYMNPYVSTAFGHFPLYVQYDWLTLFGF